jgi:hypothetical protein
MNVRLLTYWEALRGSYWFVPVLMAGSAVGLALMTLALDDATKDTVVGGMGWIYAGGAEGAHTDGTGRPQVR